jgi:putative FmdB family regulatory protein
MPIYAYKCADCGHEQEVLQKISDPPLTDCPECGRSSMAKQVTAAGFQLKGTGWYVTDFRNKDAGGKNGKATKTEGATDAKADGKTDGKADGMSDGKADGKTDGKADAKPGGPAPAAAAASTGKHGCGSGGCASCS